MSLTLTKDGKIHLHVWREGLEYWNQKSPVFLKEWNNIRFGTLPYPPQRGFIFYDVRKPLPFEDNTFDAVNIYHVFEHLTLKEADGFLKELYRVTKKNAVVRISVPDLERIANDYIKYLEIALKDPSDKNLKNYHWSALELFDQMVREKCGGMMLEAFQSQYYNEDFIKERYGDVFNEFLPSQKATPEPEEERMPPKSKKERLASLTPAKI